MLQVCELLTRVTVMTCPDVEDVVAQVYVGPSVTVGDDGRRTSAANAMVIVPPAPSAPVDDVVKATDHVEAALATEGFAENVTADGAGALTVSISDGELDAP
jgi:hypothetical protein